MIDMCAEQGWLAVTLRIQQLMQMVLQASWIQASPLLILPHMKEQFLTLFLRHKNFIYSLPSLQSACLENYDLFLSILHTELPDAKIEEVSSGAPRNKQACFRNQSANKSIILVSDVQYSNSSTDIEH